MKYIFRCEKLVRDRTPDFMAEHGYVIEIATLDHKEHIKALKAKLLEEAMEINCAHTRSELIEEIADLKEVIDALVLKLSIKGSEIDEIKRKKCMKSGGFDRGIFLKTVEAPHDSEIAVRFLQEPLKYPRTTAHDQTLDSSQ